MSDRVKIECRDVQQIQVYEILIFDSTQFSDSFHPIFKEYRWYSKHALAVESLTGLRLLRSTDDVSFLKTSFEGHPNIRLSH